MGLLQAVEPLVGEEGVRPALSVGSASASASLQARAFTEQASQSHPYPLVQWEKTSTCGRA